MESHQTIQDLKLPVESEDQEGKERAELEQAQHPGAGDLEQRNARNGDADGAGQPAAQP